MGSGHDKCNDDLMTLDDLLMMIVFMFDCVCGGGSVHTTSREISQ